MAAPQTPKTTQGWQLRKPGELKPETDCLSWTSEMPLPELGPTDVSVKLHAAALNFRDIAMVRGIYPLPVNEDVVPGSDGAGEVIAVGNRVDRFNIGDRVMPYLFNVKYAGGSAPTTDAPETALGSTLDGVFRQHGVFVQESLVLVPAGLSYEEGAAIQGPFATAWNALMGGALKMQAGDYLVVEGSGISSIAAIQLAAAAGANVIATTSSEQKGEWLKELGAKHIINYKENPAWGVIAKGLSPGGRGVKYILNMVGDPDSYRQSLEAIAPGGEIVAIGFLQTAAAEDQIGPSFFETLLKPCSVRGVQMASKMQLEEVCRVIETSGIKPKFDDNIFELKDLKGAYEYLASQKNFGKVTIKMT